MKIQDLVFLGTFLAYVFNSFTQRYVDFKNE